MGLSREELARAAESGIEILDDAVPAVTPLDIPGVRGRITGVSHPFPNGVSRARLEPSSADTAIRKVVDRFSAEDKAFGWFVGPGSTPPDLPGRLEAAGLEKVEEWAGLALTDLTQPMASNPALRVEQVPAEILRNHTDMVTRAFGFGLTVDVARVMVAMIEGLEQHHDARSYLVLGEESDGPIAFGVMTDTPYPGVMNLALAATLEEYRGKGVYRSLVARRIVDARSSGAVALVTQAARETSAPILRKLGFVEVCSLDLYAWMPVS